MKRYIQQNGTRLKLKQNEYNQKIAHKKLYIAMCLKLFDNQRKGTKKNRN